MRGRISIRAAVGVTVILVALSGLVIASGAFVLVSLDSREWGKLVASIIATLVTFTIMVAVVRGIVNRREE